MQNEYQKSRYKETNRHRTLIAFLTAIGLMLVCSAIVMGIRIDKITITGNSQYTDDEIVDMLFEGKKDYNTVYSYYKDKTKAHEKIPFIQEYKIIFQSFNEIEIIIYEKSIVGCIQYMSNYMYFDKDGIVLESSDEPIEGIPLIEGLNFKQIVLYQPLAVEKEKIFSDILNLSQMLESSEIKVDKIDFDANLNITLHIATAKVYLGDNSYLNEKILELRDIVKQSKLDGLSGTLDLATYSLSGNTFFAFDQKR